MIKPSVFLFIGMSGCGKSTQAKMLRDYLVNDRGEKTLYTYVGDKMREMMKRDDLFTFKLANKNTAEGKIQPHFLAITAWGTELIEKYEEDMNLVMDGSPRRLMEAKVLDETFEFYGRENVVPIYVEVSEQWVRQRMQERGRFDDTEEKIKNRLEFFANFVEPALEYYRGESKNKLVTVSGEGSIDEVHQRIITALGYGR